jgi:hypothetical protein
METGEQRQRKLEAVEEQLRELAGKDPDELARKELSSEINFLDAVPYFEWMLDFCRQLNQCDLSRLPNQQLDAILNSCLTIQHLIRQVEEFTLNQNTPGDVCRNIIEEVARACDGVVNSFLLPLAFTATQSTDYAQIVREAEQYRTIMNAEMEKFRGYLKSCQEDVERVLTAVKALSAQAGVSTNAQIFDLEAERFENEARNWLKWTRVAVAGTFFATLVFLVSAFLYHPADLSKAFQYVVAKLLVLSVLYFTTVWCTRIYRAQKHNETLNRHRANALKTFQAFVEGTSDDRVKDAILLQAAQAVFAGRSTGFDYPERELPTINPVVEVLGRTLPQSGRASGTGSE